MVCDLQGVYVPESLTYMMVDPVIHSVDYSGGSYGRTDRGKRGFEDFFATHQVTLGATVAAW